MVNCTVAGNVAGRGGGGLAGENSSQLQATNCIVWGNSASNASQIYLRSRGAQLSLSYCDVQGGKEGIEMLGSNVLAWGPGNIDADPCFAIPPSSDPNGTPDDPNDDFFVEGDYHLKSQAGRWDPASESWTKDEVTSPCIDAGDPMSPIGHEQFPNGGRINMGAYGGTAEASKSYFGGPVCETVVAGDINGDCRVDWQDLAILSRHWLADNRE